MPHSIRRRGRLTAGLLGKWRSGGWGLALAACACQGVPAVDAADRQEIQAVLERQAKAWNSGDLDGFLDGYLESPRMTFLSGDTLIRGKAQLRERYQRRYPEDERGVLSFGELAISRLGAHSYLVLGTWSLQRPPDHPHGRFTLVFQRTGAGLRILHDHSSAAEAPD